MISVMEAMVLVMEVPMKYYLQVEDILGVLVVGVVFVLEKGLLSLLTIGSFFSSYVLRVFSSWFKCDSSFWLWKIRAIHTFSGRAKNHNQ